MGDQNQTGQGLAATPQAKEEAKRGVTHARKAAEDLG
jgi:hydroxypyruvate isomerase